MAPGENALSFPEEFYLIVESSAGTTVSIAELLAAFQISWVQGTEHDKVLRPWTQTLNQDLDYNPGG